MLSNLLLDDPTVDDSEESDAEEQDGLSPQDLIKAWMASQTAILYRLYSVSYSEGVANYSDQFPDLTAADEPWQDDYSHKALEAHRASIAKMGVELAGLVAGTVVADAISNWFADNANRVNMMAESVAWTAEQHGYYSAGKGSGMECDWELDDSVKEHCGDCENLADDGPYTDESGDNPLPAMPGDGDTECGAGCQCSVSDYHPVE